MGSIPLPVFVRGTFIFHYIHHQRRLHGYSLYGGLRDHSGPSAAGRQRAGGGYMDNAPFSDRMEHEE